MGGVSGFPDFGPPCPFRSWTAARLVHLAPYSCRTSEGGSLWPMMVLHWSTRCCCLGVTWVTKRWVYDFSARIVSKLDATLNCLSCGYRNRALDPTTIYTLVTVHYSFVGPFVTRCCWLIALLTSFFAAFKIFSPSKSFTGVMKVVLCFLVQVRS